MMKKEYRLYNMILPIWLLWLFPPILLICIILNTIIDFLVVFFTMKKIKRENPFKEAKSVLLRVVSIGFLSDFIGVAFLVGFIYLDMMLRSKFNIFILERAMEGLMNDISTSILSIFIMLVAILIAGIFIYQLNMKYGLEKSEIPLEEKKIMAKYLAIITAPYTFLIPTHWWWGIF